VVGPTSGTSGTGGIGGTGTGDTGGTHGCTALVNNYLFCSMYISKFLLFCILAFAASTFANLAIKFHQYLIYRPTRSASFSF